MDKAPRSKIALLDKWYDDVVREVETLKNKVNNIAFSQGTATVAANDLELPLDGMVIEITGTTQINAIKTRGFVNGNIVRLIFASNPTVKDNTSGGTGTAKIILAGSVDFSATSDDVLTLVLSEVGGVQAWREVSRSIN